ANFACALRCGRRFDPVGCNHGVDAPSQHEVPLMKPDGHAGEATGPRVLIADGDPDMAQGLKMLLQLWGCSVVVCHDGDAAVAAAEEFLPEVVLLDIGLPKGDGVAVARRIR